VVCLKLLDGKVTFVHQTLWPHVYAVGTCGEPWQLGGLKAPSQNLLRHVRRNGLIRTDDPKSRATGGSRATALDLERRLIVLGAQIHTDGGRHAKTLESWSHWARRIKLASRVPIVRAKAELAERVRRLNAEFHGKARLPWAT
jgi:hypothetical protein